MKKDYQIDNSEIDLIGLICTVWEGKLKVAAAVVISLMALISYQSIQTNNFAAHTEIKPVTPLEANKYSAFNRVLALANNNKIIETNNTNIVEATNNNTNINIKTSADPDFVANSDLKSLGKFSTITRSSLLSYYVDILNDRIVFEDAIRKFNLLEASQYNNDQEYNEAIIKLASSIKILSPSTNVVKKGNLENSHYTVYFKHHDVEKWQRILKYVDKITNKLVKKTLIDEYNTNLLYLKEKQKYQLEDISTNINNLLIDYDRDAVDRLAYLKEQSEIAKRLEIDKNTIKVQTMGNQNVLLSNVETENSLYLRGYEALDKEIELIQSRKNKNAFVRGLFDLQKKKRAIEQDQTIDRIELIFQSALTTNKKEFLAASLNIYGSEFEFKDKTKMFMLAILIGLIIGAFYVIISKAIQSHIAIRKKTN